MRCDWISFLLIMIFAFHETTVFSLDTLTDLAAKAYISENTFDKNRKDLNSAFDTEGREQKIMPKDLEDKIRKFFIERSLLVKEIYQENIAIKQLDLPDSLENIEACFFSSSQPIKMIYKTKTITNSGVEDAYPWEQKYTIYSEFDLKGKLIKQISYDFYAKFPRFCEHAVSLDEDKKDKLYNEYGLEFNKPYNSISAHQDGHLLLHTDYYHKKVELIDFSLSLEIAQFIEEKASINQILLLSLIEYAQNKDKYLELSKKEQIIFDELLPPIKKVLSKYIVQHEEQSKWRTFLKSIGRNLCLRRASLLRH